MRSFSLLCLMLGAALLSGPTTDGAAPPAGTAGPKRANRLARESSPYLLQHAHNPVDWFPWGPEAFAKAKKENKLVFLSIGYSSCHWCHVMEKESFANAEVAKVLNKHFVCIKVDREERPDVDHVYMTALNVLGNRGGWPLSMFLTAEGKPVVGGTYWPREDREIDGEKVLGFKSRLLFIADVQQKRPKEVQDLADRIAKRTAAELAGEARGAALIALDRKLVAGALEALADTFDPVHGGFGNPRNKFRGTKFPLPSRLLLLQAEAERCRRQVVRTAALTAPPAGALGALANLHLAALYGPDRLARAAQLDGMVELTLDRMARGGIYDHLGGGFHRYSTERTWTVPHFEKMLYDNGQLLEVYARAYARGRKPQHERVLRQTIAFVARELTAPEGGFYSALDADTEGEEGRFYVWTGKEVDAVLTDKAEARLFNRAYGVDQGANFEDKYHILRLPRPLGELAAELRLTEAQLEARLARLREKLFAARARRPRPFLDKKVLTAWNGQMIAGLALAGLELGDRQAVASAERAADFVLKELRARNGRLLRTWAAAPGERARARLNGYLDDYAFLVHGLLGLHDATGEKRWLDEARQLTDTMVELHLDKERGAFFYTSRDHEKLFARAKDQFDGAQPSANSVAAANLVRLWAKTGEARYEGLARQTFKGLAVPLKVDPGSLTGLAEALSLYLEVKARN
jgi:uncharacterized protein YyaL (SSP411 family)